MNELEKALGNISEEELQIAITAVKLYRLNKVNYHKIATQL